MSHPRVRKKLDSLTFGAWTCLITVAYATVITAPCDKTRQVFTKSSGIITDGPTGSNYTQDSHCEWLIEAENASQFITLKFKSMGTECSYDYVFVYDGDSYQSSLLGSFSGKTEPQQLIATSGYMLILLYSDTNYVLDGFKAEYFIFNCPNNCSNKGTCSSHFCICESNWGGDDCSRELCPQMCSGNGICEDGQCKCNKGYSGRTCSLNVNDFSGNKWHWLSHSYDGLAPRAAHTAVYINYTDSLYIYGGYDLNSVLGSLQVYNFERSQWEDEYGNIIPFLQSSLHTSLKKRTPENDGLHKWSFDRPSFFNSYIMSSLSTQFSIDYLNVRPDVNETKPTTFMINENSFTDNTTTENKPYARYGHAACQSEDGFAIYGGKLYNGSLSSELWTYNITSKIWSLRAINSILKPPALTRHTLTAVNDEIYLFGGSTSEGEFSSRMFKIKLHSPSLENWKEIYPRGGKNLDVRVVAHSAVHHSYSHSIIVYGGVVAGVARFSKLSDRMFSFDLENHYWSELHYPRAHLRDTYVPRERAFHTATVIGNYLIVFGGYSHRHNKEEICYDNQMYLYHLGCHAWISGEILSGMGPNTGYPKTQGVFAHAAALRPPSTLLLVGGYHGNVNGDLLAFVIPGWLSGVGNVDSESSCLVHKMHAECLADPECGWCSADETCYGRTIGSNCTTNLQSLRCGGICPALGDCHSCLIHGAPIKNFESSLRQPLPSVSTKLGLHHCTWCVQNARCHHKDDNYGVCGEDTPSQSPGWWGNAGTEVVQPSQCRFLDKRPGLTFIKYHHPVNLSYPDHVTIINATTIDFNIAGSTGRNENTETEMVAQLKGYLHIPNSWSGTGEILRVCAGYSKAILKLNYTHLVANLSAFESSICSEAKWPQLSPSRLPVNFTAYKAILHSSFISHQQSKMELQHNKSHENAKVFTFEYLEPFSNGTCSKYDNCLHCLTDSACGWCELNNKCISRTTDEMTNCTKNNNWRYLTLLPSSCPNCSNYISCSHCLLNSGCEWWVEEARCGRKGRFSGVQTIQECPQPCHMRNNCSHCLDERGRCVWCEATHQCFSFSVYTSEYQFGLCREWLDRVVSSNSGSNLDVSPRRADQCKSCSQNLNCSSCLKSLSCGWCYSQDNPIRGSCIHGDFGKPHVKCDILLNISSYDAQWAYAQCPDVDECGLGLHDCHKEAICINTHGSYSCKCRRGFNGDGRATCIKTCYNNCVHGYCLGAPNYTCQCDLGWTGVDCSENCGCNNHSTCHHGIGICDDCQDWTEGEFCDKCKIGSYGNATSSHGCHKCDCNGHGDSSLGVCNSQTGECYCKDNTMEPNCDKCNKGYYGDPKRGGSCYFQCDARGFLTNAVEQGIGSHVSHSPPWGGPPIKECLWIISSENFSNNALIQLSIEPVRLNVSCDDNAIYAYDGFPDLGGNQQSQLIGVFCSNSSPGTVEAKSGNLTVHYKQGVKGQGFEAIYKILNCKNNCVNPRICKNHHCVCPDGFAGIHCEKELCPNNCSSVLKYGTCDKGYGRCVCIPGWGGMDCSIKLHPYNLVFTELFNSRYLTDTLEHLRKTLPRFGHSLVADKRGSLWMFGGFSLSHGPLNDIRLFDTRNNTWMQVTVEATPEAKMPEGRYFHAAEIIHVRQIIYIYGGLRTQAVNKQNKTLGDFWQFSIKDQRWSMILRNIQPPALAGHTLTLQKHQETESLVLIGGFSSEYGFLKDVWEYNLEKSEWVILKTSGAKPLGIFGHSAVYHASTHSIYVFGGFLYSPNETNASNKLFVLNYSSLVWNELPTFSELNDLNDNLPRARFLHSAVTTEDYMIIFGGRTFPFDVADILSAYVYNCNLWIRLIKDTDVIGQFPSYTYAQAMTLDAESGILYIVGGWDGGSQCQVTKITLPADLCQLWSSGKHTCRQYMGCSFCTVYPLGGSNSTHCYSHGKSDVCDQNNGSLIINNGATCDSKLFSKRICHNFTSCYSCLASWPVHPDDNPICQWCSAYGTGKCLTYGQDCPVSQVDGETVEQIIHVASCPRPCASTECNDCANENCIWAQYSQYESKYNITEKLNSWSCVPKTYVAKGIVKTNDIEVCFPKCHAYHDCHTCLKSKGSDSNFQDCHWATNLNQCISPTYQPLYCAGGVCGLVIKPNGIEQCPISCSNFTQCDECLRYAHCGWCALESENGLGVCTEGSLKGPEISSVHTTCDSIFFSHHEIEKKLNDTVSWNFVRCPRENECENGHHKCDPVSEHCEDLDEEYKCICSDGHRNAGGTCVPVCTQGCVRGLCVKPNECKCDFGYVGANCSIQCQCNGHSDCQGPDKLNQCIKCHNNTMSTQCEKCKPLYVGDPVNNGQCVPCSTYCNGHSSVCVHDSVDISSLSFDAAMSEIESYLKEGPVAKAKCLQCSNNTAGPKCDKCLSGFFRGSEDFRVACRPCECHGHGDMCDPVTGEKCNCENNTESDATCQTVSLSKNSAQECWRYQCVKCKDSYMGDPRNGHQCYKMMTVENKMCFDGRLIDECRVKPRSLNPGQTVFFAVVPRYMNVDIRIIIDVSQGVIDVFMSPNDSSFIISQNNSNGVYFVDLDPSFLKHDSPYTFNTFFKNNTNKNYKIESSDGTTEYNLMKYHARNLYTYVTVNEKNSLLWVRELKNRLVINLPEEVHDLLFTKFYIILKASSLEESSFKTCKGAIFFRQEQLHIDLFVFFSVFFSCFFLFLAICVVAWKAKQATDVRRARRRHVVEMLTMAKRPFASVTLLLGPQSPTVQRKRNRSKHFTNIADVRPTAVEPTEDGLAAVTSIFVTLPGGRSAPSRLALASSLVLLARQLPSSNRTFLRRRSVHNQPIPP